MTEQIFALLSAQPVLSIALGFVLAGFLAYIFRDVIKDYIKKKYQLYSEEDVSMAIERSVQLNKFYESTPEKLTPGIEARILKELKK